jgi:tetraacyldisaccharide 4'-kinase
MIEKLLRFQGLLLFPLSIIYGVVTWLRNRLFDYNILKSQEFDLPIISIGNITVGGTGKTPHVEYLIRLLQPEFNIATLSRGYRRKTSGFFLASTSSTTDEIGDEPRQLKQKFNNIAVAVDANRVRGINKLIKLEQNLKLIILDDAFQHRYVQPGISILLTDYNRTIVNDQMLPFGRLREYASERSRADIIIVTKCPDNIKPIDQRLLDKTLKMYAYQKLFFTKIVYCNPLSVFSSEAKQLALEDIKKSKPDIVILSGIANNKYFIEFVQALSNNVKILSYPDHYEYTVNDMHELIEVFSSIPSKNKIILTTEKDAMRIGQFSGLEDEIKTSMFYIPIYIEFLNNDDKDFNHLITSYVRNNKPDNILYQSKNKK